MSSNTIVMDIINLNESITYLKELLIEDTFNSTKNTILCAHDYFSININYFS